MKPGHTYVITFLILLIFKTAEGQDVHFYKHRSTFDVFSIPLETRDAWKEKGNLAPNASFEQAGTEGGRPIIEGWQVKGQSVYVVDTNSDRSAAYTGGQAILLHRDTAYETAESSGIISDYLPVIPGHYHFSFYVRGEGLGTTKYRIGQKMTDAVEVYLWYYDKNKNPIRDKKFNPFLKQVFDNSRKNLQFTKYWRIDSLGWGIAYPRTASYPFFEGEVPENCAFVRIEFGLKGFGRLWIDDVEYRYSKWNFTPLERVRPLAEKDFAVYELLTPSPKQVYGTDKSRPLVSKRGEEQLYPIILLPKNPAPETKKAAELLKERLLEELQKNGHEDVEIAVVSDQDIDEIEEPRLVFSIGKTTAYQKYGVKDAASQIEGKEQGYLIATEESAKKTIVFLCGNEAIGDYYAATTAAQLIGPGKYNMSEVFDWPDMLGRSYVLQNWETTEQVEYDLRQMDEMSRYKFNKAYTRYDMKHPQKHWWAPCEAREEGIRRIGGKCGQEQVISYAYMVNPYYHFGTFAPLLDTMKPELLNRFVHSHPEDIQMLKNNIGQALDAGAECLMLAVDDFTPRSQDSYDYYDLYHPDDVRAYGSLENAHAATINELYTWIEQEYGDIRFEFCPPWYGGFFLERSFEKGVYYTKNLVRMIPGDVAIVWTGSGVRSLYIDHLDIQYFASLAGRMPMYWDNTTYARYTFASEYTHTPGRSRICNLFEPFDILLPPDFYQYNHGRHMYTNGNPNQEPAMVQFFTVADYQWNNAAYDPERSMWKVMVQRYGKETTLMLLEFNDYLFKVRDMAVRAARAKQKGENPEAYIEKGKMFVNQLNETFTHLQKALAEKPRFVKELKKQMETEIKRL